MEIEEQSLVEIPISTINMEYMKASISGQEAIRELKKVTKRISPWKMIKAFIDGSLSNSKEEGTRMDIEWVAFNEVADHVRQSKEIFCCRLEE